MGDGKQETRKRLHNGDIDQDDDETIPHGNENNTHKDKGNLVDDNNNNKNDNDNDTTTNNNNDNDDDDACSLNKKTSTKRKRKRKRKNKNDDNSDNTENNNNNQSNNEEKIRQSVDHTVFVEGIPFECTETQVKEFFTTNGCKDVLELRLPCWQDTGRLRGYGHVVFNTTESRELALKELNGKHLGKRYLTIQPAKAPTNGIGTSTGTGATSQRPRPQPEGCRTIRVGNLPYSSTEDEIKQAFQSQCGKILDVRVARNYQTHQSKGFAYVEFKNPEGAHAAVHSGTTVKLKGRLCRVDYEDVGTPKGSFKRPKKL